MKVALFANGIVGQQIAEFIAKEFPQDLVVVVTTGEDGVHKKMKELGIPTVVGSDDNLLASELEGKIDVGVLAWWPHIVKKRVLALAPAGFINTHPSLLPYNRGKHYNFWALVEGAPFGVTLHRVDEGIDTGEIVAQQAISYDWTDTGATLYTKAQEAIVALFREAYPTWRSGTIRSFPQDNSKGSFHRAAELDAASRIDLNASYSGRQLLDLLRARTFPGHPGCWFEHDGQRFEISIDIKKVN